jgi:thiosulfate/3-mercaptopyruvate sulfurtransferase
MHPPGGIEQKFTMLTPSLAPFILLPFVGGNSSLAQIQTPITQRRRSLVSIELSGALVSTAWLAEHLGENDLRIFDCTVFLDFDPEEGIVIRGGRSEYEEAHIPGAVFLDLYGDLSVQKDGVDLLMPPPKAFSETLSAAGLGDEHRVVLYSAGSVMWATRMWWMLRASGFTNAAVLDGGLQQWKAEGRPTASGQEAYPPTTFTARPDIARWADKATVLAEIGSDAVCTINTLSPEAYSGTGEQTPFERQAYGRQGRIKGSLNVPYADLLTEEGLFAPEEQLRQAFEAAGAFDKQRVICYCGAGISSTIGALALHMLGYDDVAIYDGSMHEWGRDHSLPMDVG